MCARIGVVRNMVYLAGTRKKSRGKWVGGWQNPVTRASTRISLVLSFSPRVGTRFAICGRSTAGAQCQVHRSTLVLRALTHSVRFLFGHNYASCANALVRRRSCVFVPAKPETFSAVSIDSSRPFASTWLSSFLPSCVTSRIGSLFLGSWRIDFLPAVWGCLMLDRYRRVISLGLFDVRLS